PSTTGTSCLARAPCNGQAFCGRTIHTAATAAAARSADRQRVSTSEEESIREAGGDSKPRRWASQWRRQAGGSEWRNGKTRAVPAVKRMVAMTLPSEAAWTRCRERSHARGGYRLLSRPGRRRGQKVPVQRRAGGGRESFPGPPH